MHRAIVLVLREKADIVHRDGRGGVLRSATRTLDIPSVIRLRRYVRIPYPVEDPAHAGGADAPRRLPLRLLRAAGRDDRPRHPPLQGRPAHVGELRGVVHAPQHIRKADKLLEEIGWQLRVPPVVPPRAPLEADRRPARRRPAMGPLTSRSPRPRIRIMTWVLSDDVTGFPGDAEDWLLRDPVRNTVPLTVLRGCGAASSATTTSAAGSSKATRSPAPSCTPRPTRSCWEQSRSARWVPWPAS